MQNRYLAELHGVAPNIVSNRQKASQVGNIENIGTQNNKEVHFDRCSITLSVAGDGYALIFKGDDSRPRAFS